jgi:hypothetical protein
MWVEDGLRPRPNTAAYHYILWPWIRMRPDA